MTSRSTVTASRRPLWMLRASGQVGRVAFAVLAIAGLASLWRTVSVPTPAQEVVRFAAPSPPDVAGAGFAVTFAREYLTWRAADPGAHQRALAGLLGPTVDPDLGLLPAAGTSERVLWTQVVDSGAAPGGGPGDRIYAVAVASQPGGLRYLSVPVARGASGALTLGGYPAFVGAPATAPFDGVGAGGATVTDPGLLAVVARALRNYLTGATADLAADLVLGARVPSPPDRLALGQLQQVRWLAVPQLIVARVLATDRLGTQYTLGYRLGVTRAAARWEITSIQTTSPD